MYHKSVHLEIININYEKITFPVKASTVTGIESTDVRGYNSQGELKNRRINDSSYVKGISSLSSMMSSILYCTSSNS